MAAPRGSGAAGSATTRGRGVTHDPGGPGEEPGAGWIGEELAREFPELALFSQELPGGRRRSSAEVKHRLEVLSNRFRGAHAIALRQAPVPWAYRVFFRHVGLDPEVTRTPIEAMTLTRLVEGRFRSRNLLDDAITIALVETGVPIWAVDTKTLDGPLGMRLARDAERLGRGPAAAHAPPGRIVVADAARPIVSVFGEVPAAHAVTPETTAMTLFTIRVPGVPAISVEEALWECSMLLHE